MQYCSDKPLILGRGRGSFLAGAKKMEYSENKINALRERAELDGFFNLELSEQDYHEYQDKFCHYPPDTSSETVAFESERKNEAFRSF